MQQKVDAQKKLDVSEEQWQARIDLAAAHRLAVMHGFHEGIFNHLTLTVPGTSDCYYQIPFGLHWSEVNASCFMEVDYQCNIVKGSGHVERSCYAIHAPIHELVPHGACVMHTHMPYASALTRLEDPRIKPIGQTEVGMMKHIAYDMEYPGPAFDPAEGRRLAGLFGDKTILFMGNHGVATIGKTVAEAYDKLYYVERAAQVQLYAMWTGQPLRELSQDVVTNTKKSFGGNDFGDKKPCDFHFAALKRILDRQEPDYKD
ncbi:MAG: class II aldolase/adducin family protein [Hyphomicrobiaceae bacterium]